MAAVAAQPIQLIISKHMEKMYYSDKKGRLLRSVPNVSCPTEECIKRIQLKAPTDPYIVRSFRQCEKRKLRWQNDAARYKEEILKCVEEMLEKCKVKYCSPAPAESNKATGLLWGVSTFTIALFYLI